MLKSSFQCCTANWDNYVIEKKNKTSLLFSECADAMVNCSECSAYNICTVCDGDLVVNVTGDGCTGKRHYNINIELITTI